MVRAVNIVGGVRKKTVCGTVEKQRTEWDKTKKIEAYSTFNTSSSSDGSGTPTPLSSPKQTSQLEGRINNSEDVAAGKN